MNQFKKLMIESKQLEVFEVIRLLQGFLADKGIKAQVQKLENFFNVYVSGYLDNNNSADEENNKTKKFPKAQLLTYFKSLEICEEAEITKTKFGYTIAMIPESEKLMEQKIEEEGTQAGDVAVGKKVSYPQQNESEDEPYTCCICEKEAYGYGNNPFPISNNPLDRACDVCNATYVLPARLDMLKKESLTEAEKEDIKHNINSNKVLDDKFIWLFNILDEDGEEIEDNIEVLEDAIEVLIENNAVFLIAMPYVNPNPDDPNVELVFADNPGPITVYDREKATTYLSQNNANRDEQEVEEEELEELEQRESTEREEVEMITEGMSSKPYGANHLKGKQMRTISEIITYARRKGLLNDDQWLEVNQAFHDVFTYLSFRADEEGQVDMLESIEVEEDTNIIEEANNSEAERFYLELQDYFPSISKYNFTYRRHLAFRKACIDYIEVNYDDYDIEVTLSSKEAMYEVAGEIFDEVISEFLYVTEESKEDSSEEARDLLKENVEASNEYEQEVKDYIINYVDTSVINQIASDMNFDKNNDELGANGFVDLVMDIIEQLPDYSDFQGDNEFVASLALFGSELLWDFIGNAPISKALGESRTVKESYLARDLNDYEMKVLKEALAYGRKHQIYNDDAWSKIVDSYKNIKEFLDEAEMAEKSFKAESE